MDIKYFALMSKQSDYHKMVGHRFQDFKILLQRKKVNMTTYFNDNDNINHSPQRGLTPPGVCIPFSYTSFNHLKQKQVQKIKEKKSGNKITYLNARKPI